MAKKKPVEEVAEAENHERWLLSYADMITLLVAFFVMMYSMSVVNIKKFQQVAIAIRSGFGGDLGMKGVSIVDQGWPTTAKDTPPRSAPGKSRKIVPAVEKAGTPPIGQEPLNIFEYAKAQLATLRMDQSFLPLLDLDASEGNRLRVILSDRILFDPGQRELSTVARQEVARIGALLTDSTFKIAIDGYSGPVRDDLGMGWELSLDRARQVALALTRESKINPRRLMISGYGEWKDPGKTRKLKMNQQGAWEEVPVESSQQPTRDLVVLSIIVK